MVHDELLPIQPPLFRVKSTSIKRTACKGTIGSSCPPPRPAPGEAAASSHRSAVLPRVPRITVATWRLKVLRYGSTQPELAPSRRYPYPVAGVRLPAASLDRAVIVYARHEPASPVSRDDPFVERARRLARVDVHNIEDPRRPNKALDKTSEARLEREVPGVAARAYDPTGRGSDITHSTRGQTP